MFRVHSPDFKDGGDMPQRFTCEGSDLSPRIEWDGAPQGTKSFLLVVEDPDAPMGTFVHWIAYDIPAECRELPGDLRSAPAWMKEGRNDFGQKGYGGPCPPKGHGPHRYHFILRALDVPTLGLPDGARIGDVTRAIKGHALAEARWTGRFKR